MSDGSAASVKFGLLCWNQYTSWADLRTAGVGCPPPYDAESMERLITEVKPMLEAG